VINKRSTTWSWFSGVGDHDENTPQNSTTTMQLRETVPKIRQTASRGFRQLLSYW